MTKPLPHIQGPGTEPQGVVDLKLPDCIQLKTEADQIAFRQFIDQVCQYAIQAYLQSKGSQ